MIYRPISFGLPQRLPSGSRDSLEESEREGELREDEPVQGAAFRAAKNLLN